MAQRRSISVRCEFVRQTPDEQVEFEEAIHALLIEITRLQLEGAEGKPLKNQRLHKGSEVAMTPGIDKRCR